MGKKYRYSNNSKKAKKLQLKTAKYVLGLGALGIFGITESISATVVGTFGLGISLYVFKSQIKKGKEKNLSKSGIREIDQMDGVQFEYYLSALLKQMGYKVSTTSTTGDYGADLILNKDGQKVVVQAKRYRNKVGIKAIQEIVSSKLYYTATEAWVITNSFYTKPAIELAEANGVKLIDRHHLIKLMMKVHPETGVPSAAEVLNNQSDTVLCPKCGNIMKIRYGKLGEFYGCNNYPKCKGTRNIKF